MRIIKLCFAIKEAYWITKEKKVGQTAWKNAFFA